MLAVRPQEKVGCVLCIRFEDLLKKDFVIATASARCNDPQKEPGERLSHFLKLSGMDPERDFTIKADDGHVSVAFCEEETAAKVWELLGLCNVSCMSPA